MELRLLDLYPAPLLSPQHPDCAETHFGFEGGTVVRQRGVTYVFTTENYAEPKTCLVRLSAWKSTDGVTFSRLPSLRDVTGSCGETSFSSPWSPMLVFAETEDRWLCYYVYYTHKPGSLEPWNMMGRPGLLKSQTPGREGIEGPYADHGLVPIVDEKQPWEGICQIVSFYPYLTDNGWLAFYGSNTVGSELDALSVPQEGEGNFKFHVGLMHSVRLAGPWLRNERGNPVLIDPTFVENPIVKRLPGGSYFLLFDGGMADHISYSTSSDGLSWAPAKRLVLPAARPPSLHEMRTPLGMVENGDGSYDLYFTAFDGNNPDKIPPLWHQGFGQLWKASVVLE